MGKGTPKYPGAADASHYAIAERDKSTAKREENQALGGRRRPASGGRDDMSRRGHGSSLKPPQRQGAGRSRAVRQTFFLRAKIFQRQKGGADAHRTTGTHIRDGVQRNRMHERGGSAARRMEASLLFGDRAVPVFASGAQIPDSPQPRGYDENQGRDNRRREMEDNEWNRCH